MPRTLNSIEAIVQRNKDGKPTLIQETINKPTPESHQAVVKITHIAQNPTDVQSFDKDAMGDGSVFGCDFSGIVESIGDNVTRVEPGDKIAGLIWGGTSFPHIHNNTFTNCPRRNQRPRRIRTVHPRRRAYQLQDSKQHHPRSSIDCPPRRRHSLARPVLQRLPPHSPQERCHRPRLGRQLLRRPIHNPACAHAGPQRHHHVFAAQL